MVSVEYRNPCNRKVLRCFVAKTQNPVRATSCRFDSDLRHLLLQGLVGVLVQWFPHILMRGPFVDHSVSGSLYF